MFAWFDTDIAVFSKEFSRYGETETNTRDCSNQLTTPSSMYGATDESRETIVGKFL
jgi:hypothetical protein